MRRLAGFVSAAALVFTVGCGQTDAGITTAVKSKMAADDMVKAYEVDVTTRDHVVTLSGDVDTPAARERAIAIARDTDGVRDVIDQLTVTETAATSGIDVDVDVNDDLGADADRTGDRVADSAKRGANAAKNAAERAGEATVDATKKAGRAIEDAVTDDDPDTDRDGK